MTLRKFSCCEVHGEGGEEGGERGGEGGEGGGEVRGRREKVLGCEWHRRAFFGCNSCI